MKTLKNKQNLSIQQWVARLFAGGLLGLAICSLFITSCKDGEYTPVEEEDSTIVSPSPKGDVVGKVVAGYQGWFGAAGDGSPFNSWRHWAVSGAPAPNNQSFELYPDIREYSKTYATGYAALGNGNPANLFSHWDDQTVDLHFKWMKQYGVQTAAVQRFGNYLLKDARDRGFKDGIMQKAKVAAEAHQVKFYVAYDISGWTNFSTELKEDWTNKMEAHVSSPMYAKQNGKPVVSIWGLGVANRPGDVNSYLDLINWFKEKGYYVIIGVAKFWRSDTANMEAYKAADMVSPWSVGSMRNLEKVDEYIKDLKADLEFLTANKQDYQPVVFPGFAWSNWKPGTPRNEIPRLHGDFMWRQFKNIVELGMQNVYIAMFDEYDEGTAIAKAAENSSQIPTNQYFLTLDADGVEVSSDFYLRLTKDAGKMLRRETPVQREHPTPHK